MAPKTRGSTTNKNDTAGSSPRRVPHCTKCGRPRAGHPRSGCPFVDDLPPVTPVKEEGDAIPRVPTTPVKGRRKLVADDINDAMGSMYIGSSPTREQEDKVIHNRRRKSRLSGIPPLQPAESLVSLSSTSEEIVENLLRPGAFDDDTEEEDGRTTPTGKHKARVIQWQETLIAATPKGRKSTGYPKSSPSSPMPGTLITPNSSFFDSYTSIPDEKPPKMHATCQTEPSFSQSATHQPSNAPVSQRKTKPLSRTMSMEQRQLFISRLGAAYAEKATIYVVPKADVHVIADTARDTGFIASVVTNEVEGDDQSLLVIGRDEEEVEKLLARVQQAERDKVTEKMTSASSSSADYAPEKPRSSTSALKAAAGGAVVGAVGAWAGLAFS